MTIVLAPRAPGRSLETLLTAAPSATTSELAAAPTVWPPSEPKPPQCSTRGRGRLAMLDGVQYTVLGRGVAPNALISITNCPGPKTNDRPRTKHTASCRRGGTRGHMLGMNPSAARACRSTAHSADFVATAADPDSGTAPSRVAAGSALPAHPPTAIAMQTRTTAVPDCRAERTPHSSASNRSGEVGGGGQIKHACPCCQIDQARQAELVPGCSEDRALLLGQWDI
jgi:hypothetical protein